MSFCTHCGTARTGEAKFCGGCGKAFAMPESGNPPPAWRGSWALMGLGLVLTALLVWGGGVLAFRAKYENTAPSPADFENLPTQDPDNPMTPVFDKAQVSVGRDHGLTPSAEEAAGSFRNP